MRKDSYPSNEGCSDSSPCVSTHTITPLDPSMIMKTTATKLLQNKIDKLHQLIQDGRYHTNLAVKYIIGVTPVQALTKLVTDNFNVNLEGITCSPEHLSIAICTDKGSVCYGEYDLKFYVDHKGRDSKQLEELVTFMNGWLGNQIDTMEFK